MSTQNKPNILFIMCDQHRYDFVGYQNKLVKTPNIDRIANNGIIFENCYTNSPVCAPARISLATGIHPLRSSCLENDSYLSVYADTYYKRIRDIGYKVGCVGKLDLAKPDPHNGKRGNRPVMYSYGFTHPYEIEGKNHAFSSTPDDVLGPYGEFLNQRGKLLTFTNSQKNAMKGNWVDKNTFTSPLEVEEHHDGFVGRKACEWLENADPEYPWHLLVSFAGPHNPYDPHPSFLEKISDNMLPQLIEDNLDGKPISQKVAQSHFLEGVSNEDKKKALKHYLAYILQIDEQIGKILDTLDKTGEADNTYIFFSSDHGEMIGDHGWYTKHTCYEGSLHIPLCVSRKSFNNRRVNSYLELMDVGETICEITGARERMGEKVDALSFANILAGGEDKHRPFIVSAETSYHASYRCIKTPEYKLIINYNDEDELYSVKDDPKELNNIADKNPQIVKTLKNTLKDSIIHNSWL